MTSAPTSTWNDIVSTSTHIDASVADAWAVLTDFPMWSDWNPLIHPIALAAPAYSFTVASRISATLHLPGQFSPVMMNTNLLTVDPPSPSTPTTATAGFSWGGYQGVGRLMTHIFYGHHFFELRVDGEGCLFTNRESFSGLVVWAGRVSGAGWYRNLMANTRKGFESMNAALKGRVEKQQADVRAAAK